ncbi:MAG TPA: serine--tRNA ligase [Candidatus Portnoybacteria bacterium]|jgi:seryl-tRNA synthetase|nr:serine--tRNA ligase [Candidatus Portnoybacteria bacterium]MDD5752047.1 serine--tRNA ligase [Candidatus Portnoybacteria bacterium]HPJ80202.1 serine--tRNA ligase [Candidatus Portnoybacteria bacterium]
MIDIKLLRENPEKVKNACKNKQVKIDIDQVIELDRKRRELIQEIEKLRAEQKKLGKDQIEQAKGLKNKIKELEPELEKAELNFNILFSQVPNIPLDDVPVGKDALENKVLREVGKKPNFNFKPKDYLEIAEKLDIIDIKRAGKVSGSRFGYIKGELAMLEFGLIQLALDITKKQGFIPIIPPVMIKPEMMKAMGYVERGGDEIYYFDKDDLCLTGTSEQSIGPMYADEVFEEKDLPKRYVAFSTCFRREAGSYGKDTKGILRVHQFDKVEMFIFSKPKDSQREHELILSIEEKLMKELKIPYRVVGICTGDLGDSAAKRYDIEAWMPGQDEYRETHSTSNCTDFQARRLNIKYKSKNQISHVKTEYVHTLNGTAFAIGRTLIAIIENYQQKDGSIKVPKILRKYIRFKCITIK